MQQGQDVGVEMALVWQRPSRTNPDLVDVVEVARLPHGVRLRTNLTVPITISAGAWADFLAAVKVGEFDLNQPD